MIYEKTAKPESPVRYWRCVVEKYDADGNNPIEMDVLVRCLANCDCTYFAILHDKDINDDGSIKRAHYHIVLDFSQTGKRLSTVLNLLSDGLACDKNRISCLKVLTAFGAIRYLVHMDDPTKFQYPTTDIVTNNEATLNLALKIRDINDFDGLMNILVSCDDIVDVIRVIGLETYSRYHYAIDKMYSYSRIIVKKNT
jgi:hypothetical protein